MNTKEYVKKYILNITNKFRHNHFIQDLTIDFLTLLETGKTSTSEYKIKCFENNVNVIKQKWNAINNKTIFGLPNKLWNYFYATVIIKMKEELFLEIMESRKKETERRKNIREERKRMENEFFDNFYQTFFSRIFSGIPKPISSFDVLGLSYNSTKDEVNKAYRKLSMIFHPDKGGKKDNFLKIT